MISKQHRALLCSDQGEEELLQLCIVISYRRWWSKYKQARWVVLGTFRLLFKRITNRTFKTSHNYRFSACETRIQIPQSGCCDRCRPHGHAQAAPINIFNSLTGFWDSTSFVKWSPKVCFSIFPAKHFKFYLPQWWKWSKDMQKSTSGVMGSSAGCLDLHVTAEEVISITIGCLKVMTLPEFSKKIVQRETGKDQKCRNRVKS